MEEDLQTVGMFHLGQVYDLSRFVSVAGVGQRSMNKFECHEEVDEADL